MLDLSLSRLVLLTIDKFQVELVTVFALYTHHPPPTITLERFRDYVYKKISLVSVSTLPTAVPALLISHWLVLALSTNSRGAVAYAFKVCGNSVSS